MERPVAVDPPEGEEWPFGLDMSHHQDGEAQYIGLTKRRETDDEPAREITIHSRKPGHVYDMFTGEYRGEAGAWTTTVDQADVRLFSVLPYKVEELNVSTAQRPAVRGESLEGAVKVTSAGADPVRHVIHLEAIRPDGESVRYLARNLETEKGSASFSLPLALNEAPGEWTLSFTDVATGIRANIRALVK